MKRIRTILAAVVLLVVLAAVPVSAASDFSIVKTTPEDGATNTTKDNMCVKVFFSTPVGNAASKKANKGAFKITDNKGKKIPSLIYYSKEDPKYALILVDTNKVSTTAKDSPIKDGTKYTVTISKDFQDNAGNKLGNDKLRKISFTTMNQRRGTAVYMVMMIALFVGMFAFSARQAKNQTKKKEVETGKEETFNPYKEAKRTGKSVEEVTREHAKEEARVQKKVARKKNRQEKENPELILGRDGNAYKVHQRRPISAGGGTYRSGKKAQMEALAKKRAEEKARRKAENYQKHAKKPVQNKPKKRGGHR